jgi:hypothetical protein
MPGSEHRDRDHHNVAPHIAASGMVALHERGKVRRGR